MLLDTYGENRIFLDMTVKCEKPVVFNWRNTSGNREKARMISDLIIYINVVATSTKLRREHRVLVTDMNNDIGIEHA